MGRPEGWLSEDEFRACLEAKGGGDITGYQLARGRTEGVLQAITQDGNYHGSVIYYPPGYCEQAIAVRDLLKTKRKFEFVGWELWLRGIWVEERHWKPQLQTTAAKLDGWQKRFRLQIHREEKSDSERTIYDEVARSEASNAIFSRMRRRLQTDNLATVFRVLLQTAAGHFDGFEPQTGADPRTEDEVEAGIKWPSDDETQTIKALDIGQSDKDAILGQRLNLTNALLPTLHDIFRALRVGTLAEVLSAPEAAILSARNDVRNGMQLAQALFEANYWIFGPEAFGLRLMDWIARKSDRGMHSGFILIWMRLRRVSNDLLSSGDIALLASEAERIREPPRLVVSKRHLNKLEGAKSCALLVGFLRRAAIN